MRRNNQTTTPRATLSKARTAMLSSLTVALFATTGLLGASAVENSGPIDALVDCSDSFWAIACGTEDVEARPAIIIPAGETRIDAEMTCTIDTEQLRICHT